MANIAQFIPSQELVQDYQQAERFLQLLDSKADNFSFRTFDDSDKKRPALVKNLYGSLSHHWDALCRLNNNGAGVFVVINETKPNGTTDQDVTRIRAVYPDFDTEQSANVRLAEMQAKMGTKPTIYVESSPQKHHAYWIADGIELAEFRPMQKAVISLFDSDKSVHNESRVMRMPGFFHRKGEPFLTRIIDTGEPVKADDIRKTLSSVEVAPNVPSTPKKQSESAVSYQTEGFHATVNATAMRNYSAWVPLLFPTAKDYKGGYRVDSADLGRNLEEDLTFHPDGIRDFGEEHGNTAIDIMMRYGRDIRAQQSANNAAFALCDAMSIQPEALGWKLRQGDDLEQWRGAPSEESIAAVSSDAQRMADEIHKVVVKALQLADDDVNKIKVDPRPLDGIMRGAFWFPSGSRVWHITQRGNLVEHSESDAWGQLEATFGKAIDETVIDKLIALVDTGHKPGTLEEKKAQERIAKECRGVVKHKMMFYLKRHNQRRRVSRYVDMFASEAAMVLKPELVVISQPHTPFPATHYDVNVVNDYKQHFTRFDEFLKFLAAARFAPDRKKAYLWMRLLSDWGKDFLLDGVLGRDGLGIVASVSESEVEKMFEGSPVGRDPVEFLHAWVLLINEFKKVNSEIKQLERSVRLAPKHQLTAEVPVYAKVFTSAEGVASLAGDNGVEDQFANRFSAFEEGPNRITERSLYISDPDHYLESLRGYAAEVLNMEVQRYRSMGAKSSRNEAKSHIDGFHKQYGIAEIHGRLDERIPEIAADIRALMLSERHSLNTDVMVDGSKRLLARPARYIDEWIEENISRSERRTISLKREAIYKSMSVDGRGYERHWINGSQKRAILLKT